MKATKLIIAVYSDGSGIDSALCHGDVGMSAIQSHQIQLQWLMCSMPNKPQLGFQISNIPAEGCAYILWNASFVGDIEHSFGARALYIYLRNM